MAPIRRYLRITKFSVLECRIYLDNPALVESWLLNPRDPILPRVIESVRPLVLPKLLEEKERALGKGKKANRTVKDVVVEEAFEVSIFLTDPSTRHSLLTKHKSVFDSGIDPNLTALDGQGAIHIREESDEDHGFEELSNIPQSRGPTTDQDVDMRRRRKRRHTRRSSITSGNIEISDDSSAPQTPEDRASKRSKHDARQDAETGLTETDDKKKLNMNTSYDGFSIYGRILCLVVKRRGKSGGRLGAGSTKPEASGQAIMEEWIASTQAAQGGETQGDE
ncbi:MAG: hypothetical protein M1829_004121 [Trizodia sp. TS-e1964]|nr:MAG: hypothetical protein M1829_004121 [Trizodia sp. TS-e1964]